MSVPKYRIINKNFLLKVMLSFIAVTFSVNPSVSNSSFNLETTQDTVTDTTDSVSQKIPQQPGEIVIPINKKAWDTSWQISKLMMNQYLQEDLGDIIPYLPGFYLKDLGSSGQELLCGYHGSDSKETMLFIDGHPIYDPIWGGIDLNFIPVRFLNEIRVDQYLASNFAMTNQEIILLTSDTCESIPYSQVSYHKAPLGYSEVDVYFSQKMSKKLKLLLGGAIKSFKGNSKSQNFEQQNFRGKINYSLTPWWSFQYSWISNKINRHALNPLISEALYTPLDATQKLTRIDHTLNINGKIFKSNIPNFNAILFFSSQEEQWRDKKLDVRLVHPGSYTGFNFQNDNSFFGQRLTLGGDFIHEWINADSLGEHRHTFGSVFMRDDFLWDNKVGVRILSRYNWYGVNGANFTGGMSACFQIGKMILVSASMSQTSRYPTFFEQYAKNFYVGNPDLAVESQRKISTEWEIKLKSNFRLKTDFYLKDIRNLIDYEPIDSLQATFVNRSTSLLFCGFDVQAVFNVIPKLQIFTEASAIDNRDLFDHPKFLVTSYIQYTDTLFQNDLIPILRLEGKLVGDRKSTIGYPYSYVSFQEKLNPVVILNAQAILDFGNLKIFLTIENLLDQKYQLILGYPMKERTLHYGLRWEFLN